MDRMDGPLGCFLSEIMQTEKNNNLICGILKRNFMGKDIRLVEVELVGVEVG